MSRVINKILRVDGLSVWTRNMNMVFNRRPIVVLTWDTCSVVTNWNKQKVEKVSTFIWSA